MIIRTYNCEVCGELFEVQCESTDGDPECPYCRDVVLQWRPGMFAIGTNKGKAVDVTQKILEEDFGLSDFKDGSREGDVVAKTPVPSTQAKEAAMQVQFEIAQQTGVTMTDQQKQQAAAFWGGGAQMQLPPAAAMSAAKQGAVAADAMGKNPMTMLHAAGKAGVLPTNMRVIARG